MYFDLFFFFSSVAQNHTLHLFCLKKIAGISEVKTVTKAVTDHIPTFISGNSVTGTNTQLGVFVHNSVCN